MQKASAETQLERLVRDIRRASTRQRVLHAAAAGLLVSTLAAALAVLASRLAWLSVPPLQAALAIIVTVPLLALLATYWRAPTVMRLLLAMEQQLGLAQQVSTAWEHHVHAPREPRTERLAAQARKLRLAHRISGLWPTQFPDSARWLPGGIAVLALCWTMSLPESLSAQNAANSDAQARATADASRAAEKRQWGLLPPPVAPRPADANEANPQPRGAGTANRREALARLGPGNESFEAGRRVALREGTQVDVGPVGQQRAVQGMAARAGAAMQRLLAMARAGTLDQDQLTALDKQTLKSLGIDAKALESALRSSAAGDQSAIERLLEEAARRLTDSSQAEQLAEGRTQGARRSRRSDAQGEGNAGRRAGAGAAPGAGPAEDGSADAGDDPVDAGMFDDAEGQAGAASSAFDDSVAGGRGGGGAGSGANQGENGLGNTDPNASTVVLQAFGSPRDGVVYRSTGLTLPNANRARLEPQATGAAEFTYQGERTFARDVVDPHHRALVRQYFLVLEQRLNAPAPTQDARR